MVEQLPGTYGLTIKFSPEAIRKFTQLEKNVLSYHDLSNIWNDIFPWIREDIKCNLDYGQSPDGTPWAGLREPYSRVVHRPRMIISPLSPIYMAYVTAPTIIVEPMRLIYHASEIFSMPTFSENHQAFYDIALRFGFITGGAIPGIQVAAREWFGISNRTWEMINRIVEFRIRQKLGEGIS